MLWDRHLAAGLVRVRQLTTCGAGLQPAADLQSATPDAVVRPQLGKLPQTHHDDSRSLATVDVAGRNS